MKKITLTLIVAIFCVVISAPVYAAEFKGKIGTAEPVTTVIGGARFEPSTGVHVTVTSITTAYCVSSAHDSALNKDSGKAFAALSADTTISWLPLTGVATTPACPAGGAAMPTGTWQK